MCKFLNAHHSSAKRAVPVSNQRVGHHERDGVRVRPPYRFHCDGDVSQGHLVITHTDLTRGRYDSVSASFCVFIVWLYVM